MISIQDIKTSQNIDTICVRNIDVIRLELALFLNTRDKTREYVKHERNMQQDWKYSLSKLSGKINPSQARTSGLNPNVALEIYKRSDRACPGYQDINF